MKRFVYVTVATLALLCAMCLFFSCGSEAETETGDKSAAAPAPVTENATNEKAQMRAATAENATCAHVFGAWTAVGKDGAVTRECEVCHTAETLTKQENIARIYENTPNDRTEFVGYGCPRTEYEDRYEEIFSLLMEYGVTGIVTARQFAGIEYLARFLEAAKKTGIDVYGDCMAMAGREVSQKFLLFDGLTDCIKGLYLRDEPLSNMFPLLADTVAGLELRGLDEGLDMAPGLFPSGCDPYPGDGETVYTWQEAAYAAFEEIGANAVCFDNYPFNSYVLGAGDGIAGYVKNLVQAKIAADTYGGKFWTYLSTTVNIVGGPNSPNREQMLFITHLSLACGADKLLLFTAFEDSDATYTFPGMVNKNVEVQPVAAYVKNASDCVNAMKGVHRSFQVDTILPIHQDDYTEIVKTTDGAGYLSETGGYAQLACVDTEDTGFVGCGKDADGNTGLYLVNTQYVDAEATAEYVLYFDCECVYQIWGNDGLEDIGFAEKLTVTLDAGDGVYIILGRPYTD